MFLNFYETITSHILIALLNSSMDPNTGRLVVHEEGNSMLEPFRRVADSAVPTRPDEFVGQPPFKATSYQV